MIQLAIGIALRSTRRANVLFVVLTLGYLATSPAAAAPRLPAKNENNIWYHYEPGSDSVFVFVHGILSDSRGAWLYEDSETGKEVYWPQLLLSDRDIGKASVFLAGYYTEPTSGDYGIRDAANDLFRYLSLRLDPAPEPVLTKRRIIFITHSTGGIVVRHMLVRRQREFSQKHVGLLLLASPSVGTRDAQRLEWLSELMNQKIGRQLSWDNQFLEELDLDFKNLVDERTIPCLAGREVIENHFIIKFLFLFDKQVLVEPMSAGRYFGEPQRIPNTDHFGVAKPSSIRHPSHILLREFLEKKVYPPCEGGSKTKVVLAMDSTLPELVYCPQSVKEGRTNADDITEVLDDLPGLRIDKETTSLSWAREEQVKRESPDLILLHISAFYNRTNPNDENKKLLSFLRYMASTPTKFVLYTRSMELRRPGAGEAWVGRITAQVPQLRGKLHLFTFQKGESYCFGMSSAARGRLRETVKQILGLGG